MPSDRKTAGTICRATWKQNALLLAGRVQQAEAPAKPPDGGKNMLIGHLKLFYFYEAHHKIPSLVCSVDQAFSRINILGPSYFVANGIG